VKRFAFLPILLLAVALAAEVLRFEPALGTVSQYRLRQKTTAQVLQSSVKTTDNSPVPAAFANLPSTLAAALNSEQTQDISEKVVGIAPDGTRQLETTVSSTTNGQKFGYTVFSSLSPVGVATVQKAEYDEATKKLLQGAPFELPLEFFTQIPPIYGKPLEVGSSFGLVSQNTDSLAAFQAIAKAVGGTAKLEGFETTVTYTYRGRNSASEHVFDIKSNTTAGKLSLQSSIFSLEQTIKNSSAEGELIYLPDGRSKSSRTITTQRFQQTQTISLGQTTSLVVLVEADSTTEIITELMP
jgi:hypothetical protein